MPNCPGVFPTVRALIASGFGGFSRASASIIQSNINQGGGAAESLPPKPPKLEGFTHIVVPTAADEHKLAAVLGVSVNDLLTLPLVTPDWAIDCVRYKELLDGENFRWRKKLAPVLEPEPTKRARAEAIDLQRDAERTPPREEEHTPPQEAPLEQPAEQPVQDKPSEEPAHPPDAPELKLSPGHIKEEPNDIENRITDSTTFEQLMVMVKKEQTDNQFIPQKYLCPVSVETQNYWESQKHNFEFAHKTKHVNNNEHLTSVFEKLMKNYEILRDKGRFFAYRDVVSRLKAYPTRVNSAEELRGKYGFGEKMLRKIAEILQTGTVQRIQAMDQMQYLKSVKEMSAVWGVGSTIADKLYKLGYRSIADMKARPPLVLNESQLIGLQFHEEFSDKMPREEVKRICDQVEEAAKARAGTRALTIVPCGSYRRGRAFCSDADMLMTFEDMLPSEGFLNLLVADLTAQGLITHTLQISEHWDPTKKHSHHMFAGVARLPAGKHRRLDIKIYPRKTFAWALLHFTGSANFNRSIRLFAKKKGFKLTDGGYYPTLRCVRDGGGHLPAFRHRLQNS